MAKKILTDKQKIDKFIQWIKNEKEGAFDHADGGSSSFNWGYAEAMEKVYNKVKRHFKDNP